MSRSLGFASFNRLAVTGPAQAEANTESCANALFTVSGVSPHDGSSSRTMRGAMF